VLRACRRVLKAGAPFAFFVVVTAAGLSSRDIERAVEAGPAYVEAGPGYPVFLRQAGFADIEIVDVTDEYALTLSESIRVREVEATQLRDLIGMDVFAEGQADRRRELTAINDGLLQRHLISAARRRRELTAINDGLLQRHLISAARL
jgi:hypothetical protein